MYNFSQIAGRCFGNEKLVKTAEPVQKVQNNFARVARKYFADEANNAPVKESSAQEKLLAKFKELNDGKFKDNANKFIKDNFDLIAESAGSKAGARVINHVKELCSKHDLNDVFEWLMQPKEKDVSFVEFMKSKQQPAKEEKTEATQKAVPEAAPAANQAPKAEETKAAEEKTKSVSPPAKSAEEKKEAAVQKAAKTAEAMISAENNPKVQQALSNNDLTVADLQGFVDTINKVRKTGNNLWQEIKYELGPQETIDFFKSLVKAKNEYLSERAKLKNKALNQGWMD